MEHQKDGQLVYIKDLLFAVLYRWKTVLAVMLVLALLAGGAGFLLGGKASPADAQKQEIYAAEKAAMDQRILALQKTVIERQTHLDQSLLMQLDPYNHYEAQLTVSLQLTEAEPGFDDLFVTQALLEAYRAVVTEETCLAKLAEILRQPAQYASELISATAPALGTDTLTVTVKCGDAQTAAALADAVKAHLEQYHAQISRDVAPHGLSVLKSTALATADSALAETQRVEVVRLAEMLSALTDARNKRNALAQPDTASAVKTALILAIAGAIAGAFVTLCLIWVGHIGSGKVYSGRTLRNRTGVKILGALGSGCKHGAVQKWLRKLEGRAATDDASLIATDIALRAEAVSILVTGSSDSREAVAEALEKAMPQARITQAPSVLECPQALQALAACEKVVLVEACGKSRYQAVEKQLEKFEDYGKALIGCVVVE